MLPLNVRFKVIRDSIHGYVGITEHEYEILQSSYFNRLHYINQHGLANHVYPNATVSRFSHSIGVLSVSDRYLQSLLQNTCSILGKTTRDMERMFGRDVTSVRKIMRYAALLHDIGQGCFSHATEIIMRNLLMVKYPDEQKEYERIAYRLWESAASSRDRIKPLEFKPEMFFKYHEFFSCKIITQENEIRKPIVRDHTSPADVASVVVGTRMDGASLSDNGIAILHKILSNHLDADKMDYMLRDSYYLGVSYGVTDIDRVIDNAFLAQWEGQWNIVFHERALSAIEDMLSSRLLLFRWIYYHHLVALYDLLLETFAFELVVRHVVDPRFFHWGNYCHCVGPSQVRCHLATDSWMLQEGKRLLKTKKVATSYLAALYDRRRLPVSIWKRYDTMRRDLWDRLKNKGFSDSEVKNRIEQFIRPQTVQDLQKIERGLMGYLKSKRMIDPACERIRLKMRTVSPYGWRGEPLLVGTVETEGKLKLLPASAFSPYIQAMVDELSQVNQLYCYYFNSYKDREDMKKKAKRIKPHIVDYISTQMTLAGG